MSAYPSSDSRRRLSLRLEWANGPLNTRSLRCAVAGAPAPVGMTVGGLWSRKKRGSTSLKVTLRGIRQINVKGGGQECPHYFFFVARIRPFAAVGAWQSHLALTVYARSLTRLNCAEFRDDASGWVTTQPGASGLGLSQVSQKRRDLGHPAYAVRLKPYPDTKPETKAVAHLGSGITGVGDLTLAAWAPTLSQKTRKDGPPAFAKNAKVGHPPQTKRRVSKSWGTRSPFTGLLRLACKAGTTLQIVSSNNEKQDFGKTI
jgi:hypothetical protein